MIHPYDNPEPIERTAGIMGWIIIGVIALLLFALTAVLWCEALSVRDVWGIYQ